MHYASVYSPASSCRTVIVCDTSSFSASYPHVRSLTPCIPLLEVWLVGNHSVRHLLSVLNTHFAPCSSKLLEHSFVGGRRSESSHPLPLPISRTHACVTSCAIAHAGISFVTRDLRASEFERKRRKLRRQGERGTATETKATRERWKLQHEDLLDVQRDGSV